ncbi:MAG TPA: hypothetical protein VKU44_04380, partial [Terriglobia bacterium]|nr:hypothetical protein [Terriglobia bacterium]
MTSAILVTVLVLAVVAAVLMWARGRAGGLKTTGELKPESLIDLSVRAAAGADNIPDAKGIAERAARDTTLVQSYQSELLFRDRSISDLQEKGYISVEWKMKYARPARFQVLQSSWSPYGYQYDEWVCVGDQLYESTGQWQKKAENTRAEWNLSLRADKFLNILRTAQPSSAGLYRYRGVLYYLLTYHLDALSDFGPLATLLKGGPYQVQAWVHASTNLLARADVVAAA